MRVVMQGPDPDKLAQDIEKAVQEGLKAASEGLNAASEGRAAAEQARAEARQAVDEARAAIEQVRYQSGRGFPYQGPPDIPPEAVDMALGLFAMIAFIVVGLPLARAFARRMDRRGEAAAAAPDASPRLERIEQAVDAIAVEVERISENQRYASRMMQELRGLPQPNGEAGWAGSERTAEPVPRRDQRG